MNHKIVETCAGCYAEDLVDRPVRVIASGIDCYVVSSMGTLADATPAGQPDPYFPDDELHEGRVAVRAWVAGDREHDGHFTGEPIIVTVEEIQPLCADCCQPLYESQWEGPGSCFNETCFFYRTEESY